MSTYHDAAERFGGCAKRRGSVDKATKQRRPTAEPVAEHPVNLLQSIFQQLRRWDQCAW